MRFYILKRLFYTIPLLFGIMTATFVSAITRRMSWRYAFGGLALVAMIATYLPAHRASRIDPVEALQAEGRRAQG